MPRPTRKTAEIAIGSFAAQLSQLRRRRGAPMTGTMSRRDQAVDGGASFVESMSVASTHAGDLDGLEFTVKDNIDIAGSKTSFGNPSWRTQHPPAVHNALCVDQLLAAGSSCVGKVVADEFTYSLEGENFFYGTPRNAKAPDRLPGGSSSGSASSVACGLADFSVGTDSGGSLRVPASFCGIWGMRPSLHRISEAGVVPFMPSVSTVGVVAADPSVLRRAMRVLLRSPSAQTVRPQRLVAIDDAFELADNALREAAETALLQLSKRIGIPVERSRFSTVVGEDMPLTACNLLALRDLQTLEFQNTVGDWIETHSPQLGQTFAMAYRNVRNFDRTTAVRSLDLCELLFQRLRQFLTAGTIACFPTTPTIAPLKGALNHLDAIGDFYDRTMAVTSFAGVGRLPEISAPLLTVEGCPAGLSLVAAHYEDEFLLDFVSRYFADKEMSLPRYAGHSGVPRQ